MIEIILAKLSIKLTGKQRLLNPGLKIKIPGMCVFNVLVSATPA